MGKTICIANQKGGVGKTTTAINLSASIAIAEMSTLLIDIDPQANATSGLGFSPNEKGNIYDVMIQRIKIDKAVRKTAIPYLYMVPSTHDLIGAEVEFVGMEGREFVLRDMLKGIKDRFSYIILDCPPSLGLLTINALTCSDSILIPLQCEYYALEGLSQLFKTIGIIRSTLNSTLEIEGILLTMFDSRNNLCRQVAEEVRRHFTKKVFNTIIPRNVRLSESPSYGKPVILYDATCRGAVSYLELAKEIIFNERKRGDQ